MSQEFKQRVDSVLEDALSREPRERQAFLHQTCGEDVDLLREVSSLLNSHERAGSFLETPSALVRSVERALGWGEPTFVKGEVISGRFEIVRLLDRGGMGEIYQARDRHLKERVALKAIRPELAFDKKSVEHFHEEVRLARRITHRNVCRIHDIFRASNEGTPEVLFLSMEYLEGESLAKRLRRDDRVAWMEALPLLIQIAQALEAAWKERVLHRDLKSENVMLVEDGERLRAIVTDFGLASLADNVDASPVHDVGALSARASSRAAWGTPAYMSPEQLRGEPLDHRSDLFSFGVIGYEMLTGEHPYPLRNGAPLLERFRHEPPALRRIEPTIPRGLQSIIRDCLQPDPSQRPASAERVVERMAAISTMRPMTRRVALAAALSLAGASTLAVKEGPGILAFLERSLIGSPVFPLEDYVGTPAAREALKDGLAKIVEGANLKAILRFKETVRQDPHSILARLHLVQALLNVGEQNAVDDMKESLHASTIGSGDGLLSTLARAVLARAGARYSEASGILSSLSTRYRDDLFLLLSYARVVEEAGEMMRAQQLYERGAKRSSVAAVLGMGRCLAATGALPRAIALISDSLRSEALGKDPEVHGMAHSILGFALRDQGHLDAARSSFEDALNYRRQAGDRRGQVASMSNLAAIHRSSGRLRESIGIATEALEIARAMGDDSYESHALYTLARSYDLGGSDEQALSCARMSLEIELRREDHAEIPVRLNFLANIDRRRGRYGEARVLLDRALEHTVSSGDRLIEAGRVWVGARIDKEQGRYEQALEKLNNLISAGDEFNEPSIGEIKAAIAEIHDQRGEYGIAEHAGRESLDVARKRRVSRESAFSKHWLSQHLVNLGDFRSARSSLEEARTIATELHLREMLVGLDGLDATIDTHEGSPGRAPKRFQSCLEQAEHSGFANLASRCRVELAKALVQLEELDEARELLGRAKAVAARSEMLPMLSTGRIASAELEMFLGNYESALADAKIAADLARSFGGRPFVRAANALMGEAHARLGDHEEAARCFDVARRIHEQIFAGIPSQFSSTYRRHPDTIDILRRFETFARV